MQCPYCGVEGLSELDEAIWIDLSVRTLALVRNAREMRASGASLREVAAQLIGKDTPPDLGGERPRLCPVCRRSHLTAGAGVLPFDFLARLLGLSRGFLEVRGTGFRGLALALVDGSGSVSERIVTQNGEEVIRPKKQQKKKQKKKTRRGRRGGGWFDASNLPGRER